MAGFTVRYETGSLAKGTHQFHAKVFYRHADAFKEAKLVSQQMPNHHITVVKGHLELADFVNGARVDARTHVASSKRVHTVLSPEVQAAREWAAGLGKRGKRK